MASYVPAKKGVELILYIGLDSVATANEFQTNPTLASGDFKVSIDGGTLTNLATLPTVTPSGGKMVKVTLSTSEMNGDNITLVCHDASGAEWKNLIINIPTAARQIDDLATPTNITAGTITTVTNLTNPVTAGTVSDKTGYSLTTTPPTAVQIRTEMDSNSTQLAKLGTPAGVSMSADIAAVKAETASIQTGTNDLQTQVGTAGAGLTAIASAANLATLTGYVDTEVAAILAAVDTEIATLVTNVANILADTGTDGVVLSTAQMQALADMILKRGAANTENAAEACSLTELLLMAFESSASGPTLTIRKTGGTTFSTRTLTLDAAADPIVGIT